MKRIWKNRAKNIIMGITAVTTLVIFSMNSHAETAKLDNQKEQEEVYSLQFNENNYTLQTLSKGDHVVKYRAYENIVYVSNPVDVDYQIMNFYVPEAYYEGKNIANYSIQTAPIFFPNQIGGYNPAKPATIENESVYLALAQGYVVAAPGARGRTTKNGEGINTGKAPAAIVDLKAAVRYLRHNDEIMPGNAEKIIANGTSAGGALTALLGATGNNKDYEPYLSNLGAANEYDDIFAVSSYCPITNLDNADIAYEWLFNGVNSYKWRENGTLTEDQIKISQELKTMFPSYLNSLELKVPQNIHSEILKEYTALLLDVNGNGTFKEYIKYLLLSSAQRAFDKGEDLSSLTWITIKDKKITDIDLNKFVNYATRMKTPPAFDSLDAKSFENNLFGTETIDNQHFTNFSKNNSTVEGSLAEALPIKMMNPMNYIEAKGTTISQHWRIRHGSIDRDTSLAIPVMLATKLANNQYNVDFAIPWNIGHEGNYDLEELFQWINEISAN
ncbi:subtype B tannase [Lysinibacillus sp. NPDC097287]|uniref:subtype B tannase n=1 Tax=Lysinibacillus sp. NPDC097287 TaxID=3364144 RepID=UPI003808AA42